MQQRSLSGRNERVMRGAIVQHPSWLIWLLGDLLLPCLLALAACFEPPSMHASLRLSWLLCFSFLR
eukprot:12706662-Prorocentrum_lima.AAC.1